MEAKDADNTSVSRIDLGSLSPGDQKFLLEHRRALRIGRRSKHKPGHRSRAIRGRFRPRNT